MKVVTRFKQIAEPSVVWMLVITGTMVWTLVGLALVLHFGGALIDMACGG